MLQYIETHISIRIVVGALQYVAVCCGVLQCIAVDRDSQQDQHCSECVAACCIVLPAFCSIKEFVVVCCNVCSI